MSKKIISTTTNLFSKFIKTKNIFTVSSIFIFILFLSIFFIKSSAVVQIDCSTSTSSGREAGLCVNCPVVGWIPGTEADCPATKNCNGTLILETQTCDVQQTQSVQLTSPSQSGTCNYVIEWFQAVDLSGSYYASTSASYPGTCSEQYFQDCDAQVNDTNNSATYLCFGSPENNPFQVSPTGKVVLRTQLFVR